MNFERLKFWVGTPIGMSTAEYTLRLSATTAPVDAEALDALHLSKRLGSTRAASVTNKRIFSAASTCTDGRAALMLGALPDVSDLALVEGELRVGPAASPHWIGKAAGNQQTRMLSAAEHARFVNGAYLMQGMKASVANTVTLCGTDAQVQQAVLDNFYHSDILSLQVYYAEDTTSNQFISKLSPCDSAGAGFNPGRTYSVYANPTIVNSVSLAGGMHFRYGVPWQVTSFAAQYSNGPGTRNMPVLTRLHPIVDEIASIFGVTATADTAALPVPYMRDAYTLGGHFIHGWHDVLRTVVIDRATGAVDAIVCVLSCAQAAAILRAQKAFVSAAVASQLEATAAQLGTMVRQKLQIVMLSEPVTDLDIYHSLAIMNAFADGADEGDVNDFVTGGKTCATWRAEILASNMSTRIYTWIIDSTPHDYGSLAYVSYNVGTGLWTSTQDFATATNSQVLVSKAEFKMMINACGLTLEEGVAQFENDTSLKLTFGEDISVAGIDLRREVEGAWLDPRMCLWKAFANKAWQGVGRAVIAGVLEPSSWFK